MTIHKMNELPCPVCDTKLNRMADASEGQTRDPQKGDYTLCAVCLSILQFNIDNLHVLTDKEIRELPINIFKELAATALYIKLYKSKNAEH